MKFGKLDNFQEVDFTLPEDHALSKEWFSRQQSKSEKAVIYSGATSWNNPKWKGSLFEEKTKKADFLQKYSKQFNSIELNATHYRTPSDKSIDTWISETPADFKFCPKILQAISHRNNMLSNLELVNKFIIQISKLEDKLGCTFIQLPPYFKIDNLPYLRAFLKAWPQEMKLAVELRDEGFHKDQTQFQEYIDLLSEYNISPLITDVSGRRDLMHMCVNTENVFVRWVGNGLHSTDYTRIQDWTTRIKEWTKKGVRNIYFMVHEPENEKTPEIAEFLAEQLKNNEYIVHRGPKILKEAPNLFS